VWFAVSVPDGKYQQAAERLLMDYERAGPQWRRGYPGDTPHLEQAWENFAGCIERVLRQAARLEPVPWRDALRELCRRTGGSGGGQLKSDGGPGEGSASPRGDRPGRDSGPGDGNAPRHGDRPVRWWLTGSAALAVRGAPIEPGDLDLVCEAGDAVALGELFSDALIEPVAPSPADGLSEWWGRAFCEARIEWVGGVKPFVDDPEPCDFGPEAARRLETVWFEDWQILVPPLHLQRAVNERRGLAHRVAMIDALAGL
jgi:hypothetical protein